MSNLTRRAALAGLAASSVLILPTTATLAAQLAEASGLTGDRRLAEVARLLPIALDIDCKSTEAADLCEWAARKRFPPRPACLDRFDALREDIPKNYQGAELAEKLAAFDAHEAACEAVLDADPNYRALQAKADADADVVSGLYDELHTTQAGSVAGMLVKLRLLVEMKFMQRIGAPQPTIEQAYQLDQEIEDTDGLFDEITLSVWADAERLVGGKPAAGRRGGAA